MNELNPVKPMLELLPLRLDPITVLINYSQMKYLLTTLLLLFFSSCEVPEYQISSEEKENGESDLYEEQENLSRSKTEENTEHNNVYKPKPKKQDPLKSFEENSDGIIQTQAKHPYPPENPF